MLPKIEPEADSPDCTNKYSDSKVWLELSQRVTNKADYGENYKTRRYSKNSSNRALLILQIHMGQ